MRPRRIVRYTVWTNNGSASYRGRSRAMAAAHWVAGESGGAIVVANERTGQRWDISAVGRLVPDARRG